MKRAKKENLKADVVILPGVCWKVVFGWLWMTEWIEVERVCKSFRTLVVQYVRTGPARNQSPRDFLVPDWLKATWWWGGKRVLETFRDSAALVQVPLTMSLAVAWTSNHIQEMDKLVHLRM